MSKKIGLYIYTGDGIADAVDVDKLLELATGELGVAVAKKHDDLYSPAGFEMIKADVEAEELNAIAVAGYLSGTIMKG
ncbi:MAG: hypothetical protein DSZ23_00345 [Thermodesulfatator sp.]|nr:MAG: hypothetical protein DSZ23_00345 [Thermodesulfatator sp.]